MQKKILFVFFLILLFLADGCSPEKSISITKAMSIEEIIRTIEARNAQIRSMRGYGEISIDTPEISNNGSIAVRLLKPDSLLVEITGPFGVNVVKGLVTRTDFKFYNGLENKLFLGATNAKNLRTILRMHVEFSEIINLFAGCLSFSQRPSGVTPQLMWSGSECSIIYTTKDESIEYVVDTDYGSIVRYIKKDSTGEVIEEIKLKDFKRKSDFYIPFVISTSRPSLEQSLSLFYETLSVNDRPIDFTLKIPQSAVKVYL